MGQRANFEENYSGETFQEVILQEYTIQIKLKWDGGKMAILSICQSFKCANWIGIDIEINGESLDLNTCTAVKNFRRTEYERRLVQSFFSNASKRHPNSGQYSSFLSF
jgi:maltose phosphorylase